MSGETIGIQFPPRHALRSKRLAKARTDANIALALGLTLPADEAIAPAMPIAEAAPEADAPAPTAYPGSLDQAPLVGPADYLAHEAYTPGPADLVREKLGGFDPLPLKRRGFFSDMPDKGLFLGFAALGFIVIFSAKSMGYTGILTALGAVTALVAYAALASCLDAFRSNPDRLGDNCYYMGFLFTLASLSAALVALQRETASGRGDLIEALIGSFGVALFSTIAGITLRVFFMQMRREVEDLEAELRNELQRSAGLLKGQLAEAVMDLENFRLRTQQVMAQQMDQAASGFTGLAERLVDYVATAGSAYSAASEQLAMNAGRVSVEIGRLVDRVDRIEVPSDLLTRQVDDARVRIQALAGALEAAVDAGGQRQAALDQSARALDALVARLTEVSMFRGVEQSAGRFGTTMDATTGKVAEVSERLATYASSIGRLAAQIEADGQAVSRARFLIGEDLTQSTGALHKLQGTLADVADGLVARINGPPSPARDGLAQEA